MLTVLLIIVAAGLVVASVLLDSPPFAIAGLVVALVAVGLIVWPVLMARRAAAVAAEEREEHAEAVEPAAEAVEAVEPAEPAQAAEPAEPVEVAEPAAAPAEVTSVLVVPGRHRYHVAGCSLLDGREPDTLDLEEAREEGFTSCSRCMEGALTRS